MPLLTLPLDRLRSARQSAAGGRVSFEVSPALTAAVGRLARREGATPFIVLLSAFKSLLAHLSGQDDIVVGAPFANRGRPEVERVIGLFVNPVALRTDLGGDPTFRECVARVRESVLGASLHDGVPFERIVEAINPHRQPGLHPLFQVWFVFDEGAPLTEIDGLALGPFPMDRDSVRHDLRLGIGQRGGTLVGAVEYRAALFEEDTVVRLTHDYQSLLGLMLGQPESPLSAIFDSLGGRALRSRHSTTQAEA